MAASASCDRCAQQPAEFTCADCKTGVCSACWSGVHVFGPFLAHEKVRILDPSRTVELISHSVIDGEAVVGEIPRAVRELYDGKVQLHYVRWNSARCHAGLEVSLGGCTVECISNDGGHKTCFGVASNASDGFVGGVYFFSIRVVNPGSNGCIMVGFSDGKLSTSGSAHPGAGTFNGDLGAGLCLNDGSVYFPETGGKTRATSAIGAVRMCSMGVLLDLEAYKVSFFIDGKNKHNNGPFPGYNVPAGKTWFPFVNMYYQTEMIASETLQ